MSADVSYMSEVGNPPRAKEGISWDTDTAAAVLVFGAVLGLVAFRAGFGKVLTRSAS